ncbi:BRO-N domain-containing protein [Sneathia sanguinegens]|uniref:BRO-N domain-containing protein n=1 Tax=Sneathia sanguinegens TaxID=40543 RepID=UPI00288AECEB|nr:BRO family protein [Sneathia sanguinegens]
MKTFKFEDKEVRTKVIDDEIWFVAHDVTDILGFDESISKAIKDHVDKEDYMINNGIYLVNESGLYNLIFASNLLLAMKFKKWILSEVIPTIRKNMYKETYENINKRDELIEWSDKYIKCLEEIINKKDEYIKCLKEIINKKDELYEIVTRIKDTY